MPLHTWRRTLNRRFSVPTHDVDVIVVGKGNAALCAALAARDTGASVVMLEAANEDESGGNSRFAGGVMRFAYETVGRSAARHRHHRRKKIANERLRHQHARGVFRRSLPPDELPHRSRSLRDARHAEPRGDGLAAQQGRALRAELRPPVGHRERQAQVLRPHADRGLRRRRRAWCSTSTTAAKKAGIEVLYETRAIVAASTTASACQGVRAQQKGKPSRVPGEGGRSRLRRLRSESGDAHALSRPGLGARARCAARASTWATG